jgi:deoxyribose-phosphate aldolase
MKVNRYIDHTLLKATTTGDDIVQLCEEAMTNQFYAVCVNGCYVAKAKDVLKGNGPKIAAVVGFPLGAMSTKSKIYEAVHAIQDGADEIDMVINIGQLKAGNTKYVLEEIKAIKDAIDHKILKVIIETCYLTEIEKVSACNCALDAGADFVKTSTGFGLAGATEKDVLLMKKVVGDNLQIKASGGIRDYATAKRYIDLGVSRIGTSSGIKIISEEKELILHNQKR